MSETIMVVRVGVEAIAASCSVSLEPAPVTQETGPVPAKPRGWDAGSRARADQIVSAVLGVGRRHLLQVRERGPVREYRVPERMHDGWANVDGEDHDED